MAQGIRGNWRLLVVLLCLYSFRLFAVTVPFISWTIWLSACIESGSLMEDGLCLSCSVWSADLRKRMRTVHWRQWLRLKILFFHYFLFKQDVIEYCSPSFFSPLVAWIVLANWSLGCACWRVGFFRHWWKGFKEWFRIKSSSSGTLSYWWMLPFCGGLSLPWVWSYFCAEQQKSCHPSTA